MTRDRKEQDHEQREKRHAEPEDQELAHGERRTANLGEEPSRLNPEPCREHDDLDEVSNQELGNGAQHGLDRSAAGTQAAGQRSFVLP